MYIRAASAPYCVTISSGDTTLPRLFDIFAPSLITIPWVNRRSTGSSLVIMPMSRMNLVQKRE